MPRLEMVKQGHLGGYIRGGDPGTWCPNLWRWVVRRFDIRSVLDVGCGEGQSTRHFEKLGCRVRGVEGCLQAIEDGVIPERVDHHDYACGPYRPPEAPDLVWSCEFLEHVEERYLPNLAPTFASARKLILVTHAFPGQDRGHHHVNCRPTSYWIRWFERLGFRCDPSLTRQARAATLRDHPKINHFARSGLVMVRGDAGLAVAHSLAVASWCDSIRSQWKALAINLGFQVSPGLLVHRFRRRRLKRAAKMA